MKFEFYQNFYPKCIFIISSMLFIGLIDVNAQIYSFGATGAAYYDITTNTWTTRANNPGSITNAAFRSVSFDGTVFYVPLLNTGTLAVNLYTYNPTSNTFAVKALAPSPNTEWYGQYAFVAPNTLYSYFTNGSNTDFYRYVTSPAGYTIRAAGSSQYPIWATYNGSHIFGRGGSNTFKRYDIGTNTWSSMTNVPTMGTGTQGTTIADKNGFIYSVNVAANTSLAKYDPATNIWTTLPFPVTTANWSIAAYNGNDKFYAIQSTTGLFYEYNITTNTWASLAAAPSNRFQGGLGYGVVTVFPPTATVAATNATCSGATANSNGTITLTTHGSGATKVGYSAGSTYTGPDFASATTLIAAPFTVVNTLANPANEVIQPYTVRIYADATNFIDKLVTLSHTKCTAADLSLTVNPATLTKTQGEHLTYTYTLTNSGPDATANVKVKITPPSNTTLLTAVPEQGTYSDVTGIWDVGTMAVGAKTIVVTVRMN